MKLIRPINVTDTKLVSTNIAEADGLAWSSIPTYGLGERVVVTGLNSHLVFESLQAGNTNHVPVGGVTDTWWLKVGSTNRWRMFDQSIASQTTNAGTVDITVLPAERVDSVVLYNFTGASVHIVMNDSTDGVVYDHTFSMRSYVGITDWYAYFFEPVVRPTDLTVTDLPRYTTASVQIVISEPGGTASCGVAIVGLSAELGATQYGLKVGIQDYSLKQRDTFGNFSILERAYNKYAEMTVWVDNDKVDHIQSLLAGYRATPIVYQASDGFESSSVYGFYKDFSTIITYVNNSICNLTIEGLT